MWKTLPHINRRKKAPAERGWRGCSRRRITSLTVVICEFGKRDQAAVLCSSSSTHTDTVPNEAQPSSTCFFSWYSLFQHLHKKHAYIQYACVHLCIFLPIFFNKFGAFLGSLMLFLTGNCGTPVSWNTAHIWVRILLTTRASCHIDTFIHVAPEGALQADQLSI